MIIDIQELDQLLMEVTTILEGWHQDGTAWTDYDEGVRNKVNEYRIKYTYELPSGSIGLTDKELIKLYEKTTGIKKDVMALVYEKSNWFHKEKITKRPGANDGKAV